MMAMLQILMMLIFPQAQAADETDYYLARRIRPEEFLEIVQLTSQVIEKSQSATSLDSTLFIGPGRSATPVTTLLKTLYGETIALTIPFGGVKSDAPMRRGINWEKFFDAFASKWEKNIERIVIMDLAHNSGSSLLNFYRVFAEYCQKKFPHIQIETVLLANDPERFAKSLPKETRKIELSTYKELSVNFPFQHYDIKAEYEEFTVNDIGVSKPKINPFHTFFRETMTKLAIADLARLRQLFPKLKKLHPDSGLLGGNCAAVMTANPP